MPEYAIEEVQKYFDLVASKSGLETRQLKLLFNILLERLEVVPAKHIFANLGKAEKALESIDGKDVPFLALALSINCDGIWSNDRDLKRQRLVEVWNTAEVVEKTIG